MIPIAAITCHDFGLWLGSIHRFRVADCSLALRPLGGGQSSPKSTPV